jgi:pseudaminic acid cytidylyltransferase
MKDKTVAIITARGGSKRIPRKNIRDFLGYPIIKYSIDAAVSSGCFDEVMVSTEDQDIAAIAEKYGAKVPFLRSLDKSGDFATTAEVVLEVLKDYSVRGRNFKYACCIYPTAPLVSPDNIRLGLGFLDDNKADAAVSIVRFSFPIQRAFKLDSGKISMIWPENRDKRSQDLMPAYHDAGQFYWLRTESFIKKKSLFTDNTIGIEVPESEVQDIDNEEDWKIAEFKYRILRGEG